MLKIIESYKKFMGHGQPPREYALNFNVPHHIATERKPKLAPLRPLLERLREGQGKPDDVVEALQACHKFSRQLNRCAMGVAVRFHLTEQFLRLFMPATAKHVRGYAVGGGIPDSEARRQTLDLVADTARNLLDSYKLVFKAAYGSSNFRFTRLEKRFDLCAFRILELTRFKQRVKGLRYQTLGPNAWLTANIVYHVMHARQKTELFMLPLESMLDEKSGREMLGLGELFLSVQMIAKFNLMKWPTAWHSFLDSYCGSVESMAQLLEDSGGPLDRNTAVSYLYDNRPARKRRVDEAGARGPSLLVNWERLNRKVMQDYSLFFSNETSAERDRALRKFSLLSQGEGMALVQLQLECVKLDQKVLAEDEFNGQACDMRIFIGFKGVYPLLHNIHFGAGQDGVGKRLVDLLAQRSAVFAEDHNATAASLWQMQYQDEQVMEIKTQETDFTVQMAIGELAGYGIGDAGIKQPTLGVISRIYRPAARTVVVDIEKIGDRPEPVLLTSDLSCFEQFDGNNRDIIYAVLAQDAQGQPRLFFPAHSVYREHDRLVLRDAEGVRMVTLGKVQSVTKSFRCFRFFA